MNLVGAPKEFVLGVSAYLKGIYWLKSHPKASVFLTIPMILSVFVIFMGFGFLWKYQDVFFSMILFEQPTEWLWLGVYYLLKGILYLSFLILGLVFYVLLVNIFAAPCYEWVSMKVEESYTGEKSSELSLKESFLLIFEECKKFLFILILSACIFMIPYVNILSPFVSAFLLGWDFYDYPLARRGWSFSQRLKFVKEHFVGICGFGFWMLIPGLQLLSMPLAVPGGTLLALGHLKKGEKFQCD